MGNGNVRKDPGKPGALFVEKITPSFPGVDFQGRTFKAVSFRDGIFFSEPQHNKIN